MTLLDAGSIFWVARDLKFTWLQMFARWSSQVILDHIPDVPLDLAVCLNRTQRSSSFIVVEPMSRGTVVGVVVQKLKRFMSEAEAEVRAMCV